MGWFGVHSAQSAIVTLLVPGMLLWAYRKGKLWLFTLCSLLGFGLLYFTGTRVAYVGAILIAGGFLALVLLGRKRYVLCLPLAAALAALVVFQGASPHGPAPEHGQRHRVLLHREKPGDHGGGRRFRL